MSYSMTHYVMLQTWCKKEAISTLCSLVTESCWRGKSDLMVNLMTPSGDSCTEVFSQDLMGSFNDQPNTDMDSGCGTENSTEALLSTGSCTDTSVPQSLQPAVSGPQLPSVSPSEGCPQGKALLLHMHFLQSVCALRRVGCEGGVHAAELSASDSSVVGDSVCQLLSSVVGICRDSLPPLPLLRQAACVAAQAVEYWGPLGRPPEPIVIQGEDTLKELLGVLLHNDQLNRVRKSYSRLFISIAFTGPNISFRCMTFTLWMGRFLTQHDIC